eukprot:2076199-Pleurochrysis_carterae.AAC.1
MRDSLVDVGIGDELRLIHVLVLNALVGGLRHVGQRSSGMPFSFLCVRKDEGECTRQDAAGTRFARPSTRLKG